MFDEGKVTAPFVAHPYRFEVFRAGAKDDHNLCAVQRCKNVGFIGRAQLIFQGDPREKYLEAFLNQLVIQLVCQYGIGGSPAVAVRFLIANKHIKGIFLLGNGKDALLNLVDLLCLRFVKAALGDVCILQR